MHEYQVDSVDGIDVVRQWGEHARYGVERQKRLSGEIVRRYHVMIHNGEQDHGGLVTALIHRHGTATHNLKSIQNDVFENKLFFVTFALLPVQWL